ncbi:hypothetical protein EST38_g13834 [Candolleomyces aberdarensis]|uniref:F-box domain-containing protein n=1 Tax=Candolleomyces aberdarensis TaxID=2316362 RepID=A0A4Q2CYU7_9AGAR|nr:hypothetical protein EST38_g13834 [Candolleomyces aberdarensis]
MDELFNSNRAPSPQEWASTQSLLELCDQELTPVDSQIADLQKQLDKLISRRSVLQTNRRKYLDTLSARRRLPPEIIASFIQLAVAPPYDGDRPQQHWQARRGSTLPFMLVSKEWYETVCSFAHFWTQLKLDVASASGGEIPHLLEMASKRVQRASELALSLTITLSTSSEWNDKVVEFAHSISSRVGVFDISIETNHNPDPDPNSNPNSNPNPNADMGPGLLARLLRYPLSPTQRTLVWPKLRTVSVNMRSRGPPDIDLRQLEFEDVFSAPEKFPAMSSLSIAAPQCNFSAPNVPWSGLSTLSLGPFYAYRFGDYTSILKQCTEKLRVLNLCMHGLPDRGPILVTTVPLIHLAHLTHLHLEYTLTTEWFAGILLSYISLPSLQSLTCTVVDSSYHTRTEIDRLAIDRLAKLIRQSGCQESLTYLELTNFDLSLGTGATVELRSVFMETPRLSRLKISGYKLHPGLWSIIPESVQDLTVQLWIPAVGDLRPSLNEFVRSRNRLAVPSSTPMKARLDIADDSDVALVREKMDALKAQFGSLSNVVFD